MSSAAHKIHWTGAEGCVPLTAKHFTMKNRRMRRRVRAAIVSMEKHKTVGVDNIHADMFQFSPMLFAGLLTKIWAKVGSTLLIPEAWNVGVLVPLLKAGRQVDPADYRPLCILSRIRKVS